MITTGKRVATNNELKVRFGGQLMIHALVLINETTAPMQVDYLHQAGPLKGTVQHGIMQWQGEEACFSMSRREPPGRLTSHAPPAAPHVESMAKSEMNAARS